ncbi:hypothetical protein LUZ60_012714 [Juncus effusus]|nr:hypothetical protein LUZ60_012714 [Juncus effusus]
MKDMMELMAEFFNMSMEDKSEYYSDDQAKKNRLFSGSMYAKEGPKFWRDCLRLVSYPLDESIKEWPQKPKRFREVVARFVVEAREVLMLLLNLICQGLELKEGYFDGDLTGGEMPIHVNYYPTCPNPDLTLGVPAHFDNNIITLLLSGAISGLQIKHQGNWIGVEPVPNAFAINIGQQIEIITNGMLRSVEHRAVTNAVAARISIAVFLSPKMDCHIMPAEELVNKKKVLLYKSLVFEDFARSSAKNEDVMDAFKIKA